MAHTELHLPDDDSPAVQAIPRTTRRAIDFIQRRLQAGATDPRFQAQPDDSIDFRFPQAPPHLQTDFETALGRAATGLTGATSPDTEAGMGAGLDAEHFRQARLQATPLFPFTPEAGAGREDIEAQVREQLAPLEHQMQLSDEEIGRLLGAQREISRQAAISATQVQPYIEAAQRAATQLEPEAIRGIAAATYQAESGVDQAYAEALAGAKEFAAKIGTRAEREALATDPQAFNQAAESITELEGLAKSAIELNDKKAREIADKTGDLAEATADLLDIQSKTDREALRVQLETNVRNQVFDKIESRRMMQFQRDTAEAAIRAELLNQIPFEGPIGETETALSFVDRGLDSILGNAGLDVDDITRNTIEEGFLAWLESPGQRQEVINQLSAQTGISIESLEAVMSQMQERYDTGVERHSSIFGQTEFTSSAEIAQLVGSVDPQLAQSASLHEIIRRRSGGDSQFEGRGSLVGLGGLPRDAYPSLIGKTWEQVKGDPVAQTEALINYIKVNFGGDPSLALREWDS